jgi:hypothetical protein
MSVRTSDLLVDHDGSTPLSLAECTASVTRSARGTRAAPLKLAGRGSQPQRLRGTHGKVAAEGESGLVPDSLSILKSGGVAVLSGTLCAGAMCFRADTINPHERRASAGYPNLHRACKFE